MLKLQYAFKRTFVKARQTILTKIYKWLVMIWFAFNIEKYSLFFGNEIGVDLSKYLHLTNRTATFNIIKTEIEVALRKYGKVVPVSIDMRFDDSTNTIVIDLVVSPIANRNTTITVPITVST